MGCRDEDNPEAYAEHERPSQCCAPTWSWASIKGSILFKYWDEAGLWSAKYKRMARHTRLDSWGSEPILKSDPTGPMNSACYDDRAVGSSGPSSP
jgi:hypothetical protein